MSILSLFLHRTPQRQKIVFLRACQWFISVVLSWFYVSFFMTKSSKQVASARPESFEAASAELEKIVSAMEAGQMSLEASLSAYQRGAELIQYCQSKLQDAQQQVRVLEAGMLKNLSEANSDEQ